MVNHCIFGVVEILGWNFGVVEFLGVGLFVIVVVKLLSFLVWVP